MAQIINYSADGLSVMIYHTVRSQAGSASFEHKNMVLLSSIANFKNSDGSNNPDVLVATCPVAGCGMVIPIPILGGEESQRLHAHVRYQRGQQPTYPQAVQSVITAVQNAGDTPAIQQNNPLSG